MDEREGRDSSHFFFLAPAFFLTLTAQFDNVADMNIPKHPTLIRRMRDARLKKLAQTGPLVAASIVQQRVQCGRAGCRCQRGEKLAKTALTYTVHGKTRTVYVPLDLVEDVHSWVAEHKRAKTLLKEISERTIALVRTHVEHQKRLRGRR